MGGRNGGIGVVIRDWHGSFAGGYAFLVEKQYDPEILDALSIRLLYL